MYVASRMLSEYSCKPIHARTHFDKHTITHAGVELWTPLLLPVLSQAADMRTLPFSDHQPRPRLCLSTCFAKVLWLDAVSRMAVSAYCSDELCDLCDSYGQTFLLGLSTIQGAYLT